MRSCELKDEERRSFVMPESHPLRSGLTKIIEAYKESEAYGASDGNLSPDQRQFQGGRLAVILEVDEMIKALYEEPLEQDGSA